MHADDEKMMHADVTATDPSCWRDLVDLVTWRIDLRFSGIILATADNHDKTSSRALQVHLRPRVAATSSVFLSREWAPFSFSMYN